MSDYASGHIDLARLQEVLDGPWAEVRNAHRDHLDVRFLPVYGETGDQARVRITRLLTELPIELGIASAFPSEYGGRSDVGGSIVASEMLAQVDLSLMVKAGVQWGLFGGAVGALGTRRHHDAHLRDIISGKIFGCFAMTETGHGSDVQQLRTTCTYDPQTQTFDLHTPHEAARKDYIGNAARDGRMAVVFAQLITNGRRNGVHAWLVPFRDAQGNPLPGVTIGDAGPKAGLLGVDNGRLSFDHVTVPRDMLLDRYGQVAEDGTYSSPIENDSRRFFTMLGTLVRGRVSVGGAASAATKSALTIAVRYGDIRRQFETPDAGREVLLNDYLAHQRKLLPALATTYALHFAQAELVTTLGEVQGGDGPVDEHRQRELESRAAGLKAAQTWHATRTIQMCREACGGAGYLAENRLPSLKADTDVFTTFEGDNHVLTQLVAKELLTAYADDVKGMSPVEWVRFAANFAGERVLKRTAAQTIMQTILDTRQDNEEEGSLFNRGTQVKMFEDREEYMIAAVARRLQGKSKEMSPFDAFNAVQDHVLHAATAHIDRVTLEAFVAGIDTCEDEQAREVMGMVCDLYALSVIEDDKAWFIEHRFLSTERSKAVTRGINDRCRKLRPHAELLVDGFGIPEQLRYAEMLHPEHIPDADEGVEQNAR